MLEIVFFIKLVVAISFVLLLSVLAERWSPKFAGLLSSTPTGTAITLFFLGLDQGPDFASHVAIYVPIGFIAMLVLEYAYYALSSRCQKHSILISASVSAACFFVTAYFLQLFQFGTLEAVLLPILASVVFVYLLRDVDDHVIEKKTKLSGLVLFLRALAAAVIIMAVTESAQFVGPKWSGLFTAFPSTVFPLLLILHVTYGEKPVHTVIKHIPRGLPSIIAYCVAVSFFYPASGIWVGTLQAYGVALGVFGAIYLISARWSKSRWTAGSMGQRDLAVRKKKPL